MTDSQGLETDSQGLETKLDKIVLQEISNDALDVIIDEETKVKKKPMTIQLFKHSSAIDVKTIIVKAENMFKKDRVSTVQVIVKGYEGVDMHPALINSAKKKYAQAIEGGLLGFLLKHGFNDIAQATYGVAYCKAKIKKENLSFSGFDHHEYLTISKRSISAFNQLFPHLPPLSINKGGEVVNSDYYLSLRDGL